MCRASEPNVFLKRPRWPFPITRSRLLLTSGASLILVALASVGYKAYSAYSTEARWRGEIEQLGARVFVASYGAKRTGIGRIPILGDILTNRRQVELFLDNPSIVDAALDKAAEFPPLRRVWVDLTVFDRSIADRIEQKLPGMDVIFYTPAK